MTSSPRHRGLRSLAVVAVAGLLLSGCGGARPGVAASVGDDDISLSEVDQDAALVCQALEPTLESPVPMSAARAAILETLVQRTIGDQIAEEYGVEPSQSYRAGVSEQQASLEAVPEETRAAALKYVTAGAYQRSVGEAAAEVELRADGVSAPSVDQISARAQDIVSQWPNDHEVVLDPRFGLEVVDGQIVATDTAVSFGLSPAAAAGTATEPDPVYAQSLPDSQRCG